MISEQVCVKSGANMMIFFDVYNVKKRRFMERVYTHNKRVVSF